MWDCLKNRDIMRNGHMLACALNIAAVTKRIGTALFLSSDEGDLDVYTVKYNTIKSLAFFLLHSSFAFLLVNCRVRYL